MKGTERALHPDSQEILSRILVKGLIATSTAIRNKDFFVLTTPKPYFQEMVPHECTPKPERSDNIVKSLARADQDHVNIFGAACMDCDHRFTLELSTSLEAIERITKEEKPRT